MSLLQRTLGRSKKPARHPIEPALEWEWALDGVRHFAPMWSGAGGVRLYAPTLRETMGLNSGVTWSRGPEGRALDFDGTTSALLQTTNTYDWTQPFTVVGYQSYDDLTADRGMAASSEPEASTAWSWQCWMDTGNTQFGIATRANNGTIQAQYGGTPNTTDRFLVGISFDGVDQWKLWVDGDNVASITEGFPAEITTGVNVGTSQNEAGKFHDGRYFVSYHWGRELPASRHRQLARDPFGPFRMARQTMAVVPATTVSNARMADMAFCRGTVPFGVGRLPIPDGTID